ncbi:MAG: V-type ATP synthase subunit E [Coriobacteriia bacterium]|nr:V-type ATP synthase subunit E [Coriobacteriia bacterium]
MAIEDIFKALEEQGEAEIRDIVEAAREQARGIEEDAQVQAETVRSQKVEVARSAVQSKTARVTNASRLDARRMLAAVKERAISSAYDEALTRLAGLRSTASYEALFASLAEEALAGVEGDFTLLVDPADEALATRIVAGSALPGAVDATASTRGGLTVVANNGTMYRRNTIEDRLEKFRAAGQASVAEILFS